MEDANLRERSPLSSNSRYYFAWNGKVIFFATLKRRGLFGSDMDIPMAYTAKRDEIFFNIPSQLAARLEVMNLKIFRTTALLASPTVTAEQFLAQRPIRIAVQAKSVSSGHGPSHDAFGIRSKNSCCCELGSNR